MKITESNIKSLLSYWGNREINDVVPSEMKITIKDVYNWFVDFLNENGKHLRDGKIFYKTKGLTNFNHRVGIGFATYKPYLHLCYGRNAYETNSVKSIIFENGEIFLNLTKYNLYREKKISLTDYYERCNVITKGFEPYGKHQNILRLIDGLMDDCRNGGHIYWFCQGLNGTDNSIVKVL